MSEHRTPNIPPPLPPPMARVVSTIDYASPAPAEQQPKRPLLAKWGIIPFILYVISEFYFRWDTAQREAIGGPEGAVPFMFGVLLTASLFSLLAAWIFYRIFRRSTVAGTIAFAAMLLFIAFTGAVPSFVATAPVRTAANKVVTSVQTKFAAGEAALTAANVSTALDRTHIADAGEIERRLAAVQKAIDTGDDYVDAIDNLPKHLDEQLAAVGASSYVSANVQKSIQRQNQWGKNRAAYIARQRVLKEMAALLSFLARNRDGWVVDNTRNKINFLRLELLDEFNVLAAHCDEASAKEADLHKQALSGK